MAWKCNRCDEVKGDGLLEDECFLCNSCINVIQVEMQIDAERQKMEHEDEVRRSKEPFMPDSHENTRLPADRPA